MHSFFVIKAISRNDIESWLFSIKKWEFDQISGNPTFVHNCLLPDSIRIRMSESGPNMPEYFQIATVFDKYRESINKLLYQSIQREDTLNTILQEFAEEMRGVHFTKETKLKKNCETKGFATGLRSLYDRWLYYQTADVFKDIWDLIIMHIESGE